MAWKESDALSERIHFVIRALGGKEKVSHLCREFGVHRSTGHEWIKRYKGSGGQLRSLLDRSSRPHRSPNQTNDFNENKVINLRNKYGWGGKKLYELLLDEGVEISIATINRILKRNAMISKKDSITQATRRFERKTPNELWQMDFKGEFRNGRGWCYPLTLLDDHSRFSLGIKAMGNQRAIPVRQHLIRVFEAYGKPEAILTDHGSQWWSNTNCHGLTHLSVYLMKQNIEMIYSGVGHPQTQGKIERYHRTLKDYVNHHGSPNGLRQWQKTFDQFVKEYNDLRPHEALDMKVPSSRYRPSPRQFSVKPKAWQYDQGADVRRLSVHGCLSYQGKYHFVCEALAHEWVKVDAFDENRLLISFRRFPLREINLLTGETAAVSPVNNRKVSGTS